MRITDTLTKLINYLCSPTSLLMRDILVWKNDDPQIPATRTPEAVIIIERAFRLSHQTLNYQLGGLSAFHIGIIYTQWEDFGDARKQFEQARIEWSLSTKKTKECILSSPHAISLTHFAEGYAEEKRFAYEAASFAYHKAENCLNDIETTLSNNYISTLQATIKERKEYVYKQLYPSLITPPPSSDSQTHRVNSSTNSVAELDSVSPPQDNIHTPDSQLDIPIPRYNIGNSPSPSFIPDHVNNGRYQWYRTLDSANDNLPCNIEKGDYLLVDITNADITDITGIYKENIFFLIEDSPGEKKLSLKPCTTPPPLRKRISINGSAFVGSFKRKPIHGTVKLLPNPREAQIGITNIIGVVIGIWCTRA